MSQEHRHSACVVVNLDASKGLFLFSHYMSASDTQLIAYRQRLERNGIMLTPRQVEVSVLDGIYGYRRMDGGGAGVEAAENPMVRKARELFEYAVRHHASDIRFVEKNGYFSVRYIQYGRSRAIPGSQMTVSDGREVMRVVYNYLTIVINNSQLDFTLSRDAALDPKKIESMGLIAGRINTHVIDGGFVMTVRLVAAKQQASVADLDHLGYLPTQLDDLYASMYRASGIVLFVGATNSGKTTSLAAMLDRRQEITNHEEDLITVEDPVEIRMASPASFQFPMQRGWANELRSLVRQAPRGIMVGEIRDRDVAAEIFNFALAGHPVTTTLHTDSIFKAPDRLLGLGAERRLVFDPDPVSLLVCQTLLPKLCSTCKKALALSSLDQDYVAAVGAHADPTGVFVASGDTCGAAGCDGGFAGRALAAEVCRPSAEMFEIFERLGAREAKRYWVEKEGGITLPTHATMLLKSGDVDPRHVERIVGRFSTLRKAA